MAIVTGYDDWKLDSPPEYEQGPDPDEEPEVFGECEHCFGSGFINGIECPECDTTGRGPKRYAESPCPGGCQNRSGFMWLGTNGERGDACRVCHPKYGASGFTRGWRR